MSHKVYAVKEHKMVTTPSVADAGFAKMYFKADGELYKLIGSTETVISGGGGSVPANNVVGPVATTSGNIPAWSATTGELTDGYGVVTVLGSPGSDTNLVTEAAIATAIAAASGTGEVNTGSNLGAGEGVFASKVGVDLQFKTLVAGTNVTLTPTATDITIDVTGGAGTGDVVGPAVSVDNNMVLFDGVTGKLIKDSGKAVPTGDIVGASDTQTIINKTIDASNNTITNLTVNEYAAGVLDTDLTTVSALDDTIASAKAIKSYVDSQAGGQNTYDAIVAPSGGDYTTITAALAAGAVYIFVKAGTYTEAGLTLPATYPGITIVGESKDVEINIGDNSITVNGSNLNRFVNLCINQNTNTTTDTFDITNDLGHLVLENVTFYLSGTGVRNLISTTVTYTGQVVFNNCDIANASANLTTYSPTVNNINKVNFYNCIFSGTNILAYNSVLTSCSGLNSISDFYIARLVGISDETLNTSVNVNNTQLIDSEIELSGNLFGAFSVVSNSRIEASGFSMEIKNNLINSEVLALTLTLSNECNAYSAELNLSGDLICSSNNVVRDCDITSSSGGVQLGVNSKLESNRLAISDTHILVTGGEVTISNNHLSNVGVNFQSNVDCILAHNIDLSETNSIGNGTIIMGNDMSAATPDFAVGNAINVVFNGNNGIDQMVTIGNNNCITGNIFQGGGISLNNSTNVVLVGNVNVGAISNIDGTAIAANNT